MMKYSSFLSLRSRFLIAPVIGIVLAVFLYLASNATIRDHSNVLQRLSESNLPQITKISQSSLLLSDGYAQLTLLLLLAQKHQDEEKVYIDGRKILNDFHEIEHEFLISLAIDNTSDFSSAQIDSLKNIQQAFLLYKNAVIGAIELSSVDVNRAQQELLLAGQVLQDLNKQLLALSSTLIEKMTSASSLIEISLRHKNTLNVTAAILISLMLFSALYFSRSLANSLEQVNQALFNLAKGKQIEDLPEHNDQYLQRLNDAVKHFYSTLRENDRQAGELANKVALLTDSEKRITALLDITATAIIAIDSSQQIVLFNKAAEQMFGFSSKNLIGQAVSLLIPKSYRAQHSVTMNYFEAGTTKKQSENNTTPLTALKKSGEEFPIEAKVSTLVLASEVIVTVSISDISFRIAAETALLNYQEKLEGQVKKRTLELQHTVENLEDTQVLLVESEKMALLGRLVAGIAHELNTPIGICVTAASLLEDNITKLVVAFESNNISKQDFINFVATGPETIQMVLANLIRAADLISSFKLVAVDASNEMPRQLNLHNYISDVITSLKPETKQYSHQINVIGDNSLTVEAFPGSIYQVITNLIMNSMIHAFAVDESGEVEIEITSKEGTATINYKDNGMGIPSDIIPLIFEPFYTTKRGNGGSGLGMYLVYNLVTTNLKGNISCHSEVGKGTQFTINFPVKLTNEQRCI